MKNLLVTGGCGFIGSNFIHYLHTIEPSLRIYNIDSLTYAANQDNLANLKGKANYVFIQGDICDSDLVERVLIESDIDTVVHFAAETHVDRSIYGPEAFIHTNVVGTFRLLEAVKKVWLSQENSNSDQFRFHHVSTDEVYGSLSPTDPAFSESTPYAPNSPYSASKAASDHLVRSYSHTYQLPITISNCSNNYGAYQYPEKLIPLVVLNAMKGDPLPVYGDGRQIRDWLYVIDHCDAIYQILTRGKPGETYNIGGDTQLTTVEVITTICAIMDELLPQSAVLPHNQLIKYVNDRPGHDRRYAIDATKIQNELNWCPKTNFQEGILKTVNWYLQNLDWVEEMLSRKDYKIWLEKNYDQRGEDK
ncbi:MAG: dTDP-glucose 4,6-dehydratase [Anaerolineaceae bacterium]|nr:dTDP-glucose 4,6-dehydratase [Anaerolineaceae bacterium]